MDSNTQKFKYGQKVYSKVSLHSGIVTDISYSGGDDDGGGVGGAQATQQVKITIDRGEGLGEETHPGQFFTTDADVVIQLLREQMEEYKESFFRVNNTLRKQQHH